MAHFARIQDNKVAQVIVIANADCGGGDFPDSEPVGQAFIASIGLTGEWKQTSYSSSFRSKFAGVNDIFDGTDFVAPPSPEVESEV